ncbi:hypothetical protein SPRG_06606 [Saprolegnia parasitica CBS 223.65]|uniref:Transmembrane protein n=1 Tax=Saprolegnia parasitica (strain CBS 223.65) TaxID=695850 RepID=A0A067CNH1_SAPPC|nr:hypothetical protein SPRG_06606 [Saprolegnia parasitica CBS 223.65]KDO28367.1 hypothetical protein SPRG_06606 [Saprolegnia parasitica CBS 223.65]|eukprot:XP_012200815.1 hypothetical protein SPRG_06606 [Saprolegnia parasitica CBS 223.65]
MVAPVKIWLFDEADLYPKEPSHVTALDTQSYLHASKLITDDALYDDDDPFIDGDALREGGALDLMSREAIGLLGQYAAVGIIYGCLPGLLYPLYVKYLNFSGFQASSYKVLVTLCWSFKVFLGMLTDCFPIGGYKRKPYMLLGWSMCLVSVVLMALNPFPDPYIGTAIAGLSPRIIARVRGGNLSVLSKEMQTHINMDAPNQGNFWILLSTLGSFGYMLADVAADAMVVQYAQREPIAIRGRLQSAIYSVRYACSMIPLLLIGFCMNGPQYDGSFNWSMSPNLIFALLALPCVMAMWCCMFLIVEDRDVKPYFRSYLQSLWNLLRLRVMWQICAFRFLSNFFYSFDTTVTLIIPSLWANVQPLTKSITAVLNALLTSVAIYICGRYGLNWNWRVSIALATIGVLVIDASVIFVTTWGVIRNEYFFTISQLAYSLPAGIRFIVSGYCAVEIADIGNEGVVFGLVTTIVNLATPFSTACYKLIDSYLDLSNNDLARDSTHVRWQVTYAFVISYGFKFASLLFLGLLPPQKAAVQKLKRNGGANSYAATAVVVAFFVALLFSVVTNFMALFPRTSCYRIAGGNGQPIIQGNVTICG